TVETPRIRNVFIENIHCNGAKVGVFVRGLPEMPVQHIHMKNLNLTVNKGIEIKDAQHITIENALLNTQTEAPLLYIENAKDLAFKGLQFDQKQPHVGEVQGSASSNTMTKNAPIDKVNISFHHRANKDAVTLN